MKRLLLLLFALPFGAMGQTNEPQTNDELRLIEKIHYDRDVYIASDEQREKLKDLVFEMRADSTLRVHIIGYGDKWGGKEVNDSFSHVRAMYIADWMRSCRVPREQIIFVGEGIDSLATTDAEARRVEISQVVKVEVAAVKELPTEQSQQPTNTEDARAAKPIEDIDTEMQVEPETKPKAEIKEQVSNAEEVKVVETTQPKAEEVAVAESKQPFQWNYFTPRTNLLYWLGGMMNLGVEYKEPESDFGFLVNGGFSPFGSTRWNHNFGGWFLSPEVRYYFPRNDQWFVGAQFLTGGYNIKLSDTGRQGSVIGGGVMGGYKLPLSNTFDMDFTLGVGYSHLKYDTYYHDEATDTNPYEVRGVVKNTLLPIQAGVNLIWKIK